jgi:hypothetical protein
MKNSTFKLAVSPKKIALFLIGCVLFLTVANLVGQYYKDLAADNEFLSKVIGKFDLDFERNSVPTWYQSATLLLSSFLLAVIALIRQAAEDKDFRYWGLLSAVFLYLSLDEAVSIHEQLTMPLRTNFELGGIFYLSWVIPAAVFLVIFFLVFLKFLLRLPAQTRNLMIAAGGIFVLGAVGVEMVGGNYLYVTNDLPSQVLDYRYVIITTCEEFLEMLGITLFIYTLLGHLTGPALMASPVVTEKEKFDKPVEQLVLETRSP